MCINHNFEVCTFCKVCEVEHCVCITHKSMLERVCVLMCMCVCMCVSCVCVSCVCVCVCVCVSCGPTPVTARETSAW